MTSSVEARILSPVEARAAVPALADILLDCVEGGASVGFMAPFTRERAEGFWRKVADGVGAGERILLAAADPADGVPVGTVQVVFAPQENQPHRADIAKMLVHRRARGRGVGAALLAAAEGAAAAAGRSVLVLDTASDAAERLYARAGWTRVGVVPDYALLPGGGFCDTIFFCKRILQA
ncbi:MAG: GNAT family N-acetyltransferase [Alphaproteobacteria bacterium]